MRAGVVALVASGLVGVGLALASTAGAGSTPVHPRQALLASGDPVRVARGPVPSDWIDGATSEGRRTALPIVTAKSQRRETLFVRSVVPVPAATTSLSLFVRSRSGGRAWWDGSPLNRFGSGAQRMSITPDAGRHVLGLRLRAPQARAVELRVIARAQSPVPQDTPPGNTPSPSGSATPGPDEAGEDVTEITRVCLIDSPRLPEISGMAPGLADPTVLWVHNDSGDSARIFALDRRTCAIRAEVRLAGVNASDIEGIAMGRSAGGAGELWVADVGDNAAARPDVRLYRFPEPTIADQSVAVEVVTATWQGGARNCEGVAVDPVADGDVFLVSKEAPASGIHRLTGDFRATGVAGVGPALAMTGSTATDAAIAPDRHASVIRFYGSAEMRSGVLPGSGPVTVAMPVQRQGEAVSFAPDSRSVYIASEGTTDHLIRVPLSEWSK